MNETAKEFRGVQNGEDLRFELRLWINKIKFSKAQLDTLQRYLEKTVKHFGDIEMMSEVERYQNKFIVYRDVADKLVKELKFLRNRLPENDEKSIREEELILQLSEEKNSQINRARSFINIIEELKDNFVYFYTSNHVSENHIPEVKN